MILDHSFKEILSCFYTNISPKKLMVALHYIFFCKSINDVQCTKYRFIFTSNRIKFAILLVRVLSEFLKMRSNEASTKFQSADKYH